jgi:hypothetical protein
LSEQVPRHVEAGAPPDAADAQGGAAASELAKKVVRGTAGATPTEHERLGARAKPKGVNVGLPSKPQGSPNQSPGADLRAPLISRPKQNRPIDRIRDFLAPPTPPQSPAGKADEYGRVPEEERKKSSGGTDDPKGTLKGWFPKGHF